MVALTFALFLRGEGKARNKDGQPLGLPVVLVDVLSMLT
jgi:hypothetical protein